MANKKSRNKAEHNQAESRWDKNPSPLRIGKYESDDHQEYSNQRDGDSTRGNQGRSGYYNLPGTDHYQTYSSDYRNDNRSRSSEYGSREQVPSEHGHEYSESRGRSHLGDDYEHNSRYGYQGDQSSSRYGSQNKHTTPYEGNQGQQENRRGGYGYRGNQYSQDDERGGSMYGYYRGRGEDNYRDEGRDYSSQGMSGNSDDYRSSSSNYDRESEKRTDESRYDTSRRSGYRGFDQDRDNNNNDSYEERNKQKNYDRNVNY